MCRNEALPFAGRLVTGGAHSENQCAHSCSAVRHFGARMAQHAKPSPQPVVGASHEQTPPEVQAPRHGFPAQHVETSPPSKTGGGTHSTPPPPASPAVASPPWPLRAPLLSPAPSPLPAAPRPPIDGARPDAPGVPPLSPFIPENPAPVPPSPGVPALAGLPATWRPASEPAGPVWVARPQLRAVALNTAAAVRTCAIRWPA
jgi:hypothetical protein